MTAQRDGSAALGVDPERTTSTWRGLAGGIGVQLGRLVLIVSASLVLPVLGVRGWDVGLVVNALCCIYAVVLVTGCRLWRASGIARVRVAPIAVLALIPLVVEAVSWLLPAGLVDAPPGAAWWALSMLLVGVNEELISRVVVLSVLRRAFTAVPAVLIGAVLFGLQHLSQLLTGATSDPGEMIWLIVTATCFGFAYGAYQARFGWVLPLIVLHALSDWLSVLSPGRPGDVVTVVVLAVLIATGVLLLAPRFAPHALR
ncbi:CPBP family intramembrane glutamic endopeptidase [Leifsonia sp. NPDC080035]|uniref:CPBP family intramembrane glutamic endopeptidase n=1 Tax=Leifsonia sp. NPDC080035 TaxID=3143936 RepID=A0AAU7GB94_9MICO